MELWGSTLWKINEFLNIWTYSLGQPGQLNSSWSSHHDIVSIRPGAPQAREHPCEPTKILGRAWVASANSRRVKSGGGTIKDRLIHPYQVSLIRTRERQLEATRKKCLLVWKKNESVSHSVVSNSLWSPKRTVAPQAPLSMEFSRQDYWSWLPFPSPGDLPNPGIETGCPALQADSTKGATSEDLLFSSCLSWSICLSIQAVYELCILKTYSISLVVLFYLWSCFLRFCVRDRERERKEESIWYNQELYKIIYF